MRIKTPHELGLRVREAREDRAWTQADLAKRIGTSRQWVMDLERGKPTVRMGLVLKALTALGLVCDIGESSTAGPIDTKAPSLGHILERARRGGDE